MSDSDRELSESDFARSLRDVVVIGVHRAAEVELLLGNPTKAKTRFPTTATSK